MNVLGGALANSDLLAYLAGPLTAAGVKYYASRKLSRRGSMRGYGKRRRLNPRAFYNRATSATELKFADTNFAPENVPNTIAGSEADPPGVGAQTTPGQLSGVAQGDGESQRDGRKIVLKSLHIRGAVSNQSFAGSTLQGTALVRVAIILDTQTNGAQLSAEDVFLSTANVEFSFRNLRFINRFKILKQRLFIVEPKSAAGDGTANDVAAAKTTFNWFLRLNIPVMYDGTTANIASVVDNSLHVICFSDSTFNDIKYASRIRFVG